MKIAIIIGLILLLIIGIGLAAYAIIKKYIEEENSYGNEKIKMNKPVLYTGLILSILSLGLMITIPGSIHQVDTGEIAVVKHLGKVTGTRGPGIHWDFYMTNDYTMYDTKVREINIETEIYSKDNQIIILTADLQYSIDSAYVDKIAIEYGSLEKLESKINAVAIDNIKSIFSQNSASDVINNRGQIAADISEKVSSSVNSAYYVNIKTIVMTNIDFTDDFEAAVAAKVAAAQEAEKAENEARKARTEAEAAKDVAILQAEAELETAKRQAEAKLYAAEQDAQAKLLIAQAEATSTKLKAVEVARMVGFEITETADAEGNTTYDIDYGNPTTAEEIASRDARIKLLTQYLEYIKYLETWDGTLPVTLVSDDAATIVIPGA